MKSSKSCECSGKSKCIVITIETCCKKTCEDKKSQGVKIKGDDSDKNVKRVSSGPTLSDKSSSFLADDKDLSKKSTDSKVKIVEEDGTGDITLVTSDSGQQRLFKLPLVTERHHGTGCAMEISVLEKHEDKCIYKKGDVEGRNPIDDRVGSYDCIGRMVFRTCNSTETESDSSKSAFHGGSAGEKAIVEVLAPKMKEEVVETSSKTSSKLKRDKMKSSSSHTKKSKSKSPHKNCFKSDKSVKNLKSKEEVMKAKSVTPQHSMPPPRKEPLKKHYPGDGCKLHHPKDPALFLGRYIEKESVCSKDIALQTETKEPSDVSSEEVVVSLTEISKTEDKRRPSFLGAIFRRNHSAKTADVKR